MGISVFPTNGTKLELVAAADKVLYKAKQEGKNRVNLAK